MQISRQRDDRRRRVLGEEASPSAASVAEDDGAPAAGAAPRARRRGEAAKYGDPGFHGGQPRVGDLVPQTWLALSLWFLAGALFIAGLEALYFYMPRFAAHTTDGAIAAFDLDGEGSLAVWFSSVTLGLAALASLLVFSIRRHRPDDYHGRYRIWLWAAIAWLVMSIDESASLHEGFKEMMSGLAGTRIHGDGSLWWALGYGLVLLAIGGRLLFQFSSCRLALVGFVSAALCLLAAVATQLEVLLPQSGARGIMLEEGLEMAGDLLILFSTLVFARFTLLESRGELGASAKPRKKRAAKETAPPPTTNAATSAAASHSPAPAASRPQLRVDSAHASAGQRLSKAERRAMRRQGDSQYE